MESEVVVKRLRLFSFSSVVFFETEIHIPGQAFESLVSVSLMCCHTYTPDLSTFFSTRSLPSCDKEISS